MLHVFSLRRVLLAGAPSPMRAAMQAQLQLLGARPACIPDCLHAESLDRALHAGRFSCVIVPDLMMLHPQSDTKRLNALGNLLGEAREAGVPLVMLLGQIHDDETAPLFSHALGMGISGDPLSVQCIRHDGTDKKRICQEALILGARFLCGERALTGIFTQFPIA